LSQNGTFHAGGGGGSRKANFQDISITIYENASFSHFAKHVATGQHIASMEFEFYSLDEGGNMLLMHIMTMTQCMVTSLSFGDSINDSGVPIGNVTINFAQIRMTSLVMKKDLNLIGILQETDQTKKVLTNMKLQNRPNSKHFLR
jgi:type VI secretion system secreted protein Hcp